MTLYDKRLIIVITASKALEANDRASEIDTNRRDIFIVGLSSNGNPPATHYWCSWQITDTINTRLRAKLQTLIDNNVARVFNGNILSREQVLSNTGLKRINAAPN